MSMVTHVRLLTALAALSCLAALPARAQEQRPQLDEPYFGVEVMLGFAGKASLDLNAASAGGVSVMIDGADGEDVDMELGIGGGVQYIHPLHRYFAIGGRFAVLSWRSDPDVEVERDGGRNLAFDLAVVPQARLPLGSAFELYLSIPIGLTFDLLNELDASLDIPGLASGAAIDADPGFGFNLAFMLGARFGLSRNLGLFAELGYAIHSVSHEVNFTGRAVGISAGASADMDVTWSQIALNVGLYF